MAKKLSAVKPKETKPGRPKVLIYGKSGVGKTWFCLDWPSVYFIDSEGGADLKRYQERLAKSGAGYFGREQGSLDFDSVIEEVKLLATTDHGYKTLVIDSLSKIYNEYAARAELRIGNDFSKDKREANKPCRRLISWLDRIDMNVIVTCHAVADWVKGEQIGFKPDVYDKMEYELHLCLEITQPEPTKRMAFIKKSRLEGFKPSLSFEWTYEAFVAKWKVDNIDDKSRVITLGTKEQVDKLKGLIEVTRLPEDRIAKMMQKAGCEGVEEMSADFTQLCIDQLETELRKAAG